MADRDTIRGKARNLKGRVKEAAGSLTGNKRTQAEGTVDRAGGAVQEKIGQAREKIEDEE